MDKPATNIVAKGKYIVDPRTITRELVEVTFSHKERPPYFFDAEIPIIRKEFTVQFQNGLDKKELINVEYL